MSPLAAEWDLLEGLDPEDGLLEPGARWADRWDPREELRDPIDCGWIGEDREGIWVRRHPEAALAEDEALWAPADRWRLGQREVTAEVLEQSSSWQIEALVVMAAADAREQSRRLKGARDGKAAESRD